MYAIIEISLENLVLENAPLFKQLRCKMEKSK